MGRILSYFAAAIAATLALIGLAQCAVPAWEKATNPAYIALDIEKQRANMEWWANFWLFFSIGAAILFTLAVVAGIVFLVDFVIERRHRRRRQEDGSLPLIQHKYKAWDPQLQRYVIKTTLINPGKAIGVGVTLNHATGELTDDLGGLSEIAQLKQTIEHDRFVSANQAKHPGDQALKHIAKRGNVPNLQPRPERVSQMRYEDRRTDDTIRQIEQKPNVPLLNAPPLEPMMTPAQALAESRPDEWIVGQVLDPQMRHRAIWRPNIQPAIAIVGSPGTGKSTNMLMHLLGLALMSQTEPLTKDRMYPILLDGKNGADFSKFAPNMEWALSDDETFPDQINQIAIEVVRRAEILKEHKGTSHIDDLPADAQMPHLLVGIEEYDSIVSDLKMRNSKEAARIDAMLSTIARGGRYLGVHLVICSHQPKQWSDALKTATQKFVCCYSIDDSQSGVWGIYNCSELPPIGAFKMRNQGDKIFYSWNMKPYLIPLLPTLPKAIGTPILVPLQTKPAEAPADRQTIDLQQTSPNRYEDSVAAATFANVAPTPPTPPQGAPAADVAPVDQETYTAPHSDVEAWNSNSKLRFIPMVRAWLEEYPEERIWREIKPDGWGTQVGCSAVARIMFSLDAQHGVEHEKWKDLLSLAAGMLEEMRWNYWAQRENEKKGNSHGQNI